MFFLTRRLIPQIKIGYKFYSRYHNNTNIQEIIKTVDPYSSIKINSGVRIAVKPYDLLDCPDSNKLRATLTTSCEKSHGEVSVKVDGHTVEISDKDVKGNPHEITCLLEVPVKADLDIETKQMIEVSEMYSDCLKLLSQHDIHTKNVRSSMVSMVSKGGNIKCDGITLGHKIDIFAADKGNIFLDKMQGDLLHCKTEKGCITTNSSYVETSNFVTESGNLNLKNVHKKSAIYVLKEGDIKMTGIHGNIYIKSNKGDMNLQFSEIFGDNIIIGNNSKHIIINISDLIEESCFVEIHSDKITLEDSLSHLGNCMEKENYFCLGGQNDFQNKLLICTKGALKFGKMSWAESLKMSMGIKDL